jgi:hypothetical protein
MGRHIENVAEFSEKQPSVLRKVKIMTDFEMSQLSDPHLKFLQYTDRILTKIHPINRIAEPDHGTIGFSSHLSHHPVNVNRVTSTAISLEQLLKHELAGGGN